MLVNVLATKNQVIPFVPTKVIKSSRALHSLGLWLFVSTTGSTTRQHSWLKHVSPLLLYYNNKTARVATHARASGSSVLPVGIHIICGIIVISMNENQTTKNETVRPTKKQRELLTYIEAFIAEHGYSPSYREIMKAQNYNSVATVALHVNNLIKRGHLQKRENSARSLEVVTNPEPTKIKTNQIAPSEEKWLVEKVEHAFQQIENAGELAESGLDHLYVLIGALRVLGLDGAAQSFMPRLTELKQRQAE